MSRTTRAGTKLPRVKVPGPTQIFKVKKKVLPRKAKHKKQVDQECGY